MAKKAAVSREVYRPVISLVIGLIILGIINGILTSLPMIRRLMLPWFPISAGAIISLVIGIIMIVIFLNFRREFVPQLQAALPTFPESGPIVVSAINLCIIIIAYTMFDGVILPLVRGFSWVYPLVFLLIAIAPIYSLAMTLYRSSGKITDLLTGKVAEATGELVKCSKCGETTTSGTKFCPKCGTALTLPVTEVVAIKCSKCGAENKSTDKFCANCGEPLSEEPRSVTETRRKRKKS